MKKTVLQVVLLLALGCMKKIEHETGPELTSRAILSNTIAADGCEWNFYIAKKTYVPTNLDAIRLYVVKETAYFYDDSVTVRYRLTGRQKELQCGWGAKSMQDEIEVLEVKK